MKEEISMPIGLFDSGIGGFSILKEIRENLPNEDIIFLSDNARHPYGSKSERKIKTISLENSLFLSQQNSKIIVIACNTASAVAKNHIEMALDKRVVGVIDAGVRAALSMTKKRRIGIIGTKQTIKSRTHEKMIKLLHDDVEVFAKATPLFAPIVEEEYIERKSTELLIKEELEFFKNKDIDVLILGCTHYPFLRKEIASVLGENVKLVNPAKETAKEIKEILERENLINRIYSIPTTTVYFSDITATSALPEHIGEVVKIDNVNVEDLEALPLTVEVEIPQYKNTGVVSL